MLSTEIQQQQPSHLSVASGDKLVRRRSQMLASIGTEEEISKQTSLVTMKEDVFETKDGKWAPSDVQQEDQRWQAPKELQSST